MLTFVLATRNWHKMQEIREILDGRCRLMSLRDFPGAPEIVEDAHTFAGNATKKAVGLSKWLQSWKLPIVADCSEGAIAYVMADDSGLEVDVLNGAPGVRSARFAAQSGAIAHANTPDAENNALLLKLLADVPAEKRLARFRCVIALTPVLTMAPETASPACAADELELQTRIFEGTCEGTIALAPRGSGGFGYDPLFVPDGHDKSFAELGAEVKNGLSHRARALTLLKKAVLES
jgi:XTP/dITP diphosphohydrolase